MSRMQTKTMAKQIVIPNPKDYGAYRQVTGKCERCGVMMKNHPVCEACGILCGPGHLEDSLGNYRGHKICGYCPKAWERLDKELGRETTWEEFTRPTPKLLEEAVTREMMLKNK